MSNLTIVLERSIVSENVTLAVSTGIGLLSLVLCSSMFQLLEHLLSEERDETGNVERAVEKWYLVRRLQSWGATILGPAGTITQAIQLVTGTDRIDLAVLDVNLRDEKVFPVADMLSVRRIPFMFTTGYGDSIVPERFRGAAVLQKPIRKEELATVILALIA
jgi:CheY-like chemotaxis protein